MFGVYLSVIFSVVFVVTARIPAPFDVRIDYHKVETTKDLVLNTPEPKLSWKLANVNQRNVQQTGYQIQMKSNDEQWDSERVVSSQSIHVAFLNNNQLKALTHYQIRLRVWTSVSEQASAWTRWIKFRTSIFNLNEFLMEKNDQANWIGSTQIYMNELRKEFNVSNASPIQSATVLISGIGYYELYLNGQSVDASRKLDPGWTTYEKRTLFVTYDLTTTVKVSFNLLSIQKEDI